MSAQEAVMHLMCCVYLESEEEELSWLADWDQIWVWICAHLVQGSGSKTFWRVNLCHSLNTPTKEWVPCLDVYVFSPIFFYVRYKSMKPSCVLQRRKKYWSTENGFEFVTDKQFFCLLFYPFNHCMAHWRGPDPQTRNPSFNVNVTVYIYRMNVALERWWEKKIIRRRRLCPWSPHLLTHIKEHLLSRCHSNVTRICILCNLSPPQLVPPLAVAKQPVCLTGYFPW